MPKSDRADPGGAGPPTLCHCGTTPDSDETHCNKCGKPYTSQHVVSRETQAVEDYKGQGSAPSGGSANGTSMKLEEEPMDMSDEESQDTSGENMKDNSDAAAKDSHLHDMATSLKQQVCDGTLMDGHPCNAPITTEPFCVCGKRNKYVQCQGSRKDDGAPCKTFVEPGNSCPCCGHLAKPTTAGAIVEKVHITEMSVNLRPCYQKNVKESELRGKPAPQHDVKNHGKNDSTNIPVKKEAIHRGEKDKGTNLGKTDNENNRKTDRESNSTACPGKNDSTTNLGKTDNTNDVGKNDGTNDVEKNDSTNSPVGGSPKTEDISKLEVASGGVTDTANSGAVPNPALKKVFGVPIAELSNMFTNTPLSAANKTESGGGDASATAASGQNKRRSESGCQTQTIKESGDDDHENAETAKGGSDTLKSKDAHENSKEDGATKNAEESGSLTEPRGGNEGEDATDSKQKESRDAAAGDERESGGEPYRKGQEKSLVEGTKTKGGSKKNKKKGKNKENATVQTSQPLQTQSKTQGWRQVRFYVALHKDFHFNHAKDSVCIRFQHSHLGGFSGSKHRMEKVKDFSEGYVLFELTVVIPDTVCGLQRYKYVFLHRSDNANPLYIYEWMPGFNKKDQRYHNRIIHLNNTQKGVLHQYDGLMHPPAQGISLWEKFLKTVTGATHREHKEQMDEVKEVTLAMLPSWHYFYCETGTDQELIAANAEEVVERISSVYRYMESSFKNEDQRTKSNKWREILWQYLTPWKDHIRAQLAEKHSSKEEAKIRLVSSLSIVILMCKFDGHILADLAELDLVLDCLLLRPDENGDIQNAIKCVGKHFKDPRKSLLGPLQSIINILVNQVAEPHIAQKWLYIVPLIHLLFEDSSQQYIDQHETPQWWGICLFSEQQEKFKRSMEFKGELQLDFLVEQLSPLFGADPLLPRTLMTTLSWKNLLEAIPLPCFPPDACIALCYHFIKVKDFIHYREDQQVIEKCFELVVDKIKGLQSEPDDLVLESHEEKLMKSDILLNISMNLLELLIKETVGGGRWYHERVIVADAAGVLAASMKYCSHLRELSTLQDQEFSLRFRNTLTHARNRIVDWLSLVLPMRIKRSTDAFFADFLEPEVTLVVQSSLLLLITH